MNFISKNILSSKDEVENNVESVITFLTHRFNDRFMVKTSTGELTCRMPNYWHITSDNTKQMFMDIPLTVTQKCWKSLHKLGLENSVFNDNVNENVFKSSLDIFNPKRWISDVVPGEAPISPYKSETFCVFQSQQNCQLLTEAGGCCKYFCKYLAKINKQNYINILMDNKKKFSYASNSTYLHNTKFASSDI